MGHSHALSGLAVGAATLPWAPVSGPVPQVAWVAAVGGFAMLPDLDQAGSTIGRMWGPISDIPAGLVSRVARGHRWGTHDAVLGPAAFGLLAFLAARATWSSLTLLAVAIGLALHALNFVIPGRATWATGSGPNSYLGGDKSSFELSAWSQVMSWPVYVAMRPIMAIRVLLVM